MGRIKLSMPLVLLLLIPYCLIGQEAPLISLQKIEAQIYQIDRLLEKDELDSAKVVAANYLNKYRESKNSFGEQFIQTKLNELLIAEEDYKTAENIIDKQLTLPVTKTDSNLYGTVLLQKAQCLMYQNKATEAEQYFTKALSILPSNSNRIALAWNDRGFNAGRTGNFDKEGEFYLKALAAAEAQSDAYGKAMAYNNLSVLYQNLGENRQAIDYAKKSIAIREELNDYSRLLSNYSNLSQIYLTTDLKEAEHYAKLCKEIANKLNTEIATITALDTESLVQDQYGKTEVQLTNAKKILEIYKRRNNDHSGLIRRYLSVGIIMSEMRKDSTEALFHLNKGIELAKEINDKVSIRDGLLSKTIFFKIRNDFYNAYDNIKQYHLYKDSIITNNTISNIAELQTKYETEKKDYEINRLTTEQKIKELKIQQLNSDQQLKALEIEKQQAVIAGNKILAKQKEDEIQILSQKRLLQELELQQQKEVLANQVLLSRTQQQQLDLSAKEKEFQQKQINQQKQLNYIMGIAGLSLFFLTLGLFNRYKMKKKIQQQQLLLDMRDTIAKDLHDDVGSTLSSIKILSEVSYKNIGHDKEKAASLLQKIMEQSEQMQHGLSDIVWAVKPQNDKVEDLISKLKEYINQTLEPKGIDVEFHVNYTNKLKNIDLPQRKNILLICREAINNIAKYAECSKAIVEFTLKNDRIHISIKDNGKGFDLSTIKKGNGLKNMEARTLASHGQFRINSQPHQGTHIFIELPI
jgi:two-component system, NarL family, sensor histidine kinase UhpB